LKGKNTFSLARAYLLGFQERGEKGIPAELKRGKVQAEQKHVLSCLRVAKEDSENTGREPLTLCVFGKAETGRYDTLQVDKWRGGHEKGRLVVQSFIERIHPQKKGQPVEF